MLYPKNVIHVDNHKIKVLIVGCGGNGSKLLQEISALNMNLVEMGKLGLEIKVYDDDIVEKYNVGRQNFYTSDIGYNKAFVLASRINRSYGDNIEAFQERFNTSHIDKNMIIISCVDNVKTRKQIDKVYKKKANFIWIDLGNDRNSGQVILSFKDAKDKSLPTCVDLFPDMKDNPEEPSCSMRESLKRQSFTINKIIVNFAMKMISELLIDKQIGYSQLFYNGDKMLIRKK